MDQAVTTKKILRLLLIASLVVIFSVLIAKKGIMIGMVGAVLPFLIIFLLSMFKNPEMGLWIIFTLSYFVLGIIRYLPMPLGLAIDGLLILTHISILVKYFYDKRIYKKSKSALTTLAAIWYMYGLFQLVNPETVSREAWFYAMRGVSLQMLLIVPLVFMLFDKHKNLTRFLHMWMAFALLGMLKALIQKNFGVDPWEQKWLDGGGDVTHILFGKLRIFSFFSDAGQFGAHMGHTGTVFAILAINAPTNKLKRIYGFTAALFLYGMLISGTRGAMAVPIGGFAMYLILKKNIKLIVSGGAVALIFYIFIAHTSIGQSNYDIARLRSAFDPNNPSLQVRLENQKKLKSYLASRPFGGGIGSAGNWGQRFTPNTFLANTPTDSWFVMIWAEQGVIGLSLHLFILFFVLIKSSRNIMFKIRDDWLKTQLTAITAGMFGIMLASYGNGILGQMPTGIIMYMGFAFMFMGPKFDEEIEKSKKTATLKSKNE